MIKYNEAVTLELSETLRTVDDVQQTLYGTKYKKNKTNSKDSNWKTNKVSIGKNVPWGSLCLSRLGKAIDTIEVDQSTTDLLKIDAGKLEFFGGVSCFLAIVNEVEVHLNKYNGSKLSTKILTNRIIGTLKGLNGVKKNSKIKLTDEISINFEKTREVISNMITVLTQNILLVANSKIFHDIDNFTNEDKSSLLNKIAETLNIAMVINKLFYSKVRSNDIQTQFKEFTHQIKFSIISQQVEKDLKDASSLSLHVRGIMRSSYRKCFGNTILKDKDLTNEKMYDTYKKNLRGGVKESHVAFKTPGNNIYINVKYNVGFGKSVSELIRIVLAKANATILPYRVLYERVSVTEHIDNMFSIEFDKITKIKSDKLKELAQVLEVHDIILDYKECANTA